MTDASENGDTVELTDVDRAILEFLVAREATYLAVMAQELVFPVALIKDRCHALTEAGLLERQSNTYYTITAAGRQRVERDSADVR